MELVTLKIFNTELEAQLFKIFLAENGFEAFVFGSVLANTYNIFNMTSGGVHLKVREDDFEKAKNLEMEFYGGKERE
ncbi:MAG: hypothetical protein QM564_10835 [Bergeyella sp.]